MVRRTIWLPVLLATTGLSVPARGQDVCTWTQCLQQAVQTSPGLAAARAAARAAHALWRAEDSAGNPRVVASAGAGLLGLRTDDGDETAVACGAALRGEWKLYSGRRHSSKLAARSAEAEAAEWRMRIVESDVVLAVRSAFVELLYAQQCMPLADEIARHRRQNVEIVEIRYLSGMEHQGSLATSQAAHREALAEAAQARRALQVSRQRLARAMGRHPEGLSVSGDFDAGVPPVEFEAAAHVPDMPEYRLAVCRLAGGEAGIAVARSASRPDVDAVASLTPQTDEWSSDQTRWFAGLWLSYLLPLDGRVRHQTDAATAERDAAEASLTAVARDLADRLENALADYQAAVEISGLLAEAMRAAELRAQVARKEYSGGLLGFVNWDLVEADLINKRRGLLRSGRDTCLARARWERVHGPSAGSSAVGMEGLK